MTRSAQGLVLSLGLLALFACGPAPMTPDAGSGGGRAGGSAGGASAGGSAGGSAAGGSAGGASAGGSAGGASAGGSAGGASAGGSAGGSSAGGSAGGASAGGSAGGLPAIDAGVFTDGGVLLPSDTILSLSLRGNTGQVYRFNCPALGAMTSPPSVWGTNTYTDDSPICWAGLHAGRVTRTTGGDVFVEVQPGLSSYQGSLRNGLVTRDFGSFQGSYAVLGPTPPAGGPWDGGSLWDGVTLVNQGPVTWSETATGTRGLLGVRLRYTCPDLAGGSLRTIWGTSLYTDDSAVCVAGAHSGVIRLDGGVVTIEVLPGAAAYTGSTQNGITSSSYPSFSGSYRVIP